jgi:alpha-galactosidase
MKKEKSDCNSGVIINSAIPDPIIQYTSGLTVYEEQFQNGRLIGRYWSALGRTKIDRDIVPYNLNIPAHAFELNLDGQSLHNEWQLRDVGEFEEKRGHHAVLELSHSIRPVQVKIHTRLDGTPFLVRWLEVTNTGQNPAALSAVSPWCGVLSSLQRLPGAWNVPPSDYRQTPFHLGRFAGGGWAQEGRFVWDPLVNGMSAHLQMRGPFGTSGFECPYFLIRHEATSEYFVGYLAWSGPWSIEVMCDSTMYKVLHFKTGPAAEAPMRILAPGESITTPAVHLGYLQADLDTVVQAAHTHIRRSVIPARPAVSQPWVEYNHWVCLGVERLSEAGLREEVDMAEAMGAELFVVDAGWYGKGPANRRSDNFYSRFMGDWVAGEWLPNDLDPIIQKVRSKNMRFGLWIEPEGIGKESEIYKQHPEWIVQLNGKPVPDVAERFNLDLTNPDAAKWLEDELNRVVKRYELDVLRIDGAPMYRQIGERANGDYLENIAWRHYEVLYGILDRIRCQFPNLIIENCCGGGGRMDLGILSRSDWTAISDEWEAPRTIQIINGVTLMLPPELAMHTQRFFIAENGDLDLMLRTSLFGPFLISGISPSLKEANPQVIEKLRHYIQLYKTVMAPILRECRVYHHTPVIKLDDQPENSFCILEYATPNSTLAVAGIFKLNRAKSCYHFYPRGLAVDQRYRVTFDNTGQSVDMNGFQLQQDGIRINLEGALTSELLIFKAITPA